MFLKLKISMRRPFHHNLDGTFKNPKGSPRVNPSFRGFLKWFFRLEKAKKKIKIDLPDDYVVVETIIKKNLEEMKNKDYVLWIGHATFVIKLGKTTIITDPFFSKNCGPLVFGPKRYVKPALQLNDIPKIDLFLLTHNHHDHMDHKVIKTFPYKLAKVLTGLKTGDYFRKNNFKDILELDWYQTIKFRDLKIHFLPAVHWSARIIKKNETLWGSFLIEYKNKKIFFSCDTGVGNVYEELGKKYGPIDVLFINIGAYDLKPLGLKASLHLTPSEAVSVGKKLEAKKIVGMHFGTVLLSCEPILEPPQLFQNCAKDFGYLKEDLIVFKIGEIKRLEDLFK